MQAWVCLFLKLLPLWSLGYNISKLMKKKRKKQEWFDPVVEETRARGRAFTARFGNDPKKIMNYLRKIAKNNPNKKQYISEIKVVKKAS